MTLDDYRTHMASVFLTELATTLRPRTLNTIKWLGSAIFVQAVARGYCDSNPWRDARVLGKTLDDGETGVYSLEEMENINNALVDRVDAQLVMALAFFTGLRKGEIAGLQWGDIDDSFIHVRRALSRGEVGAPKSKHAVRSIPIIQPVRIPLTLWRAKTNSDKWLFPSERKTPLNLDLFANTVIKPALAGAGIEWRGYHACRRGLATALRALTGNSTAGRDVLGHGSTAVTEQHYEHTVPEEVLRGMKLLEAKARA